MAEFFTGPLAPFSLALLVMAGLVALEVLGALVGVMPSGLVDGAFDLDAGVDADGDGGAGPILGALGVGKVPLLIVLMSFLAAFGLIGLGLQHAAGAVAGAMMPGWIAWMPALALAVPATRGLATGIARVIPSDETQASSAASLIGRVAELGAQSARPGLAAEAKVADAHGQTHYVRVEPDEGDGFAPGAAVLLTRRREDGVYGAVTDPSA